MLAGGAVSAGSLLSSIGLAGPGPAVFDGTRIGGAGAAGVAGTAAGVAGIAAGVADAATGVVGTTTGGRIAIGGRWITGGDGGAGTDGSSSLSPPLRSA